MRLAPVVSELELADSRSIIAWIDCACDTTRRRDPRHADAPPRRRGVMPRMLQPAELSGALGLDARADLGEGPLWDPVTRRLLWVDVICILVHTFDPHTGLDTVRDVGAHVGAVVMRTNGGLMLAQRHGFTRLDPGAASPVTVAEPADHPAH